MVKVLLIMWRCVVILSPCISNRSRTGIRRPPSCCARAFATAPRSKRIIANLSDWPAELVEGLRTLLKGGTATPADRESIIVRRALPHGHVGAVLGTLRAIGLDRILGPAGNPPRDLAFA